MNEQNFSQTNEPTQKSNYLWIIVVIAIIIAGIYFWQKSTKDKNNTSKIDQKETVEGQVYSDTNFKYYCPDDWSMEQNQNYDGKVNFSECSKIYSGEFSFDDGVMLTFGFVPQEIANNQINEATGKKYSDTILDEVKNEENVESYTNNNFVGWISPANQKHTLALVARYQTEDGYYEVIANAMGNTKTYEQYKKMVDDIIFTFQAK